MKFNKTISLIAIAFAGKVLAKCENAKNKDFPCCESCVTYFEDDEGKWGIENNDWCVVDSSSW